MAADLNCAGVCEMEWREFQAVLDELARLRENGLHIGLTLSGERQADAVMFSLVPADLA